MKVAGEPGGAGVEVSDAWSSLPHVEIKKRVPHGRFYPVEQGGKRTLQWVQHSPHIFREKTRLFKL